jgi:hypothetical protein
MSYLRTIATLQKEERDPAKAVTISLPASMTNRIDQVIKETGLGRSSVYQALIKDGLVEYLNAPLRKALSEAREAEEHTDLMDVPESVEIDWPEEAHGGQMQPSHVIELVLQQIEENQKAVWA